MNPAASKASKDKKSNDAHGFVPEKPSQSNMSAPHANILALQRTAGNHAVTQLFQSETEAKTSADKHLKPLPSASASHFDAKALPSIVLSGTGRPLDTTTRESMELRFGYDFSQVRVHEGERAATSARKLGARAYTVASDIVFGEGRYAPNTNEGRRLLAHELAHVVQQSRGGLPPVLDRDAPHESSAQQAAADIGAGDLSVQVAGATGVGVARDEDPEIEKVLEPLKESASPEKPATPRKQKALTPDELIDNHVFLSRVEEEVGGLRTRLTKLEAKLERKPADPDLRRKVEAMRQELGVLEGKFFDPASKGTKVPGHGNINTRAAIQIVDKDGNLIALDRGRWTRGAHAEEDAIAKLRKRLGNTKLPPGSRIVVAGNQVVCSDVCRRALKKFADDYNADEVVAHVRVRPKIKGRGTASGKTTERTGLTKDAPKTHVTSEVLYQRVQAKPLQSSPTQRTPVPAQKPTAQKRQSGTPSAKAQPKVSTRRAQNTDFQTQGKVIHTDRSGARSSPPAAQISGRQRTRFSPKGAALAAEFLPAAMNALQDTIIRHRVATEMLQKWPILEKWRRDHPNDWILAAVSLQEWEIPDRTGNVARSVNYVDFFHGPTQQAAEAQADKVLRSGVPKGWREVGPFLGWIAPTDSLDEIKETVESKECFIATACYNSPLAPEVCLLRKFRDVVLQHSWAGRTFINTYYFVSPPIAAFLWQHSWLRSLTRSLLLAPLIAIGRISATRWCHEEQRKRSLLDDGDRRLIND